MNPIQSDHDAVLELVAVYALGSLGAEEARIVSAHLAVCAECRAEYAALRPAANAVALAAEDLALDAKVCARMKEAILAEIGAAAPVRRIRPARPLAFLAFAGMAAALVLAILSLQTTQRLAQVQTQLAQEHKVVADLQTAGAQTFAVPNGEILKTADRVYIVMHSLPAPPEGRVYQAWTLAPGAKAVAPSITFVPDAHGFVVVSLPKAAVDVAAVAVSVEPPGGSKAPTTKPSFVRPLS